MGEYQSSGWLKKRSWFRNAQQDTRSVDMMEQTIQSLKFDMQVASDRVGAAMEEMTRQSRELQRLADYSYEREIGLRAKSTTAKQYIEQAFAKMNEVTEETNRIQALADNMSGKMAETSAVVSEAVIHLQNTDQMMEHLFHLNTAMQQKIDGLIRHLSKVEAMNATLVDIVEETSLLSINASIEAARAGEYGRGFSVVAGHIRQLSEQSKGAVAQSTSLLSQITDGVNEVIAAVGQENVAVTQGVAEVGKVRAQIEHLYRQVEDTQGIVQQAVASSYGQADLINNSAEQLGQAVLTINETIGDVDMMLTHASEQRDQIGALNVIGDNLLKEANELRASGKGEEFIGLAEAIEQGGKLEPFKIWLTELAGDGDIITLDAGKHASLLSAKRSGAPDIQAIWSNRDDGTFIFSEPPAGLMNAKQREWWKGAMEEGLFVSSIYIDAITKRPCLTVSTAVTDPAGRRIGVVGIDLSVDGYALTSQ
ncbi:MAG: hypothetical protein K0Q59_700 [Paenibacillus sp.]|nr:hypothetical protein [Paenibacillus sp.]